ncbi:hypothetical protein [Methylobacterium sp. NFXW15]|uniref:hypothetical protein n=1 Tax=Methylobacterium sp. NFXW15 TaxID=2819512 RepID=UPI003CF32643
MRVAYLTQTKTRCFLTIKEGPGGVTVDTVIVAGKREARTYCAAHGIQAWSF